jgi:hypothetical protein
MIRKVTLILSAVVLVLIASQASAQNQQRGAACILELKNTISIITPVACDGRTGACGCGPGWVSACAPRCCKCVRCR